jgi:hypothetical protein
MFDDNVPGDEEEFEMRSTGWVRAPATTRVRSERSDRHAPLAFQPTLTARVKALDPEDVGFLAIVFDNFRRHVVAGN